MATLVLRLFLLLKLEKVIVLLDRGDKLQFGALMSLNRKYLSLWPGERGSDGTS